MSRSVAAIIVAGGRGTRAGGDIPKQYRTVQGIPVMQWTLRLFATHDGIDLVQPVIHAADEARFAAAASNLDTLPPVHGGDTRQASVLAGLQALVPHAPDIVLVHDAARPFASPALVSRAIDSAAETGAAVPALALTDSVTTVDAHGTVTGMLERAALRTVQTPQAFRFDLLLAAHQKAADAGLREFSDDASVVAWAGTPVTVFSGETGNVKLTTPADFLRAEIEAQGDLRIGTGYDVHAFGPGTQVVLGGVSIAHTHGLIGHSDADVALHALTDAVLGALADGDIGAHFPPSDPQWRGASSDRFLAFACARARAQGGFLAHLDLTLVCEAPRIGPHRDAMRARIAQIAAVPVERVAVKATTNEGLGFLGRGEGIAALATATLRLPWRRDQYG